KNLINWHPSLIIRTGRKRNWASLQDTSHGYKCPITTYHIRSSCPCRPFRRVRGTDKTLNETVRTKGGYFADDLSLSNAIIQTRCPHAWRCRVFPRIVQYAEL